MDSYHFSSGPRGTVAEHDYLEMAASSREPFPNLYGMAWASKHGRNCRKAVVAVFALGRNTKQGSTERATTRGRVSLSFNIQFSYLLFMNSFADRFSTTTAIAQMRNAQAVTGDDEDFDGAMWGSSAGFGSIAKGVPTFALPQVADVSIQIPYA